MRHPPAVFDLAVNRALVFVRAVSPSLSPGTNRRDLEEWHRRTRFVRRIPLETLLDILETCPDPSRYHWQGGASGQWVLGTPRFP